MVVKEGVSKVGQYLSDVLTYASAELLDPGTSQDPSREEA